MKIMENKMGFIKDGEIKVYKQEYSFEPKTAEDKNIEDRYTVDDLVRDSESKELEEDND